MQISVWQEIGQFFHEGFRRKPRPELTAEERYNRRGVKYFMVSVALILLGVIAPFPLLFVFNFTWAVWLWIPGVLLSGICIKFMSWYEKKGYE